MLHSRSSSSQEKGIQIVIVRRKTEDSSTIPMVSIFTGLAQFAAPRMMPDRFPERKFWRHRPPVDGRVLPRRR